MRSVIFAILLLIASGVRAGEIEAVGLDGKTLTPLSVGKNKASVLLFVTHDCPISNGYCPEYRRLQIEYAAKKIGITLVYVDPDAGKSELLKHRKEFGLKEFAAIHDARHRLVKATGATVTPEAVVIGRKGSIEYRGRVDNLYADYGKRRRQATVRDLRNALDALISGKPVPKTRTEAIGCFIPPLPNK
ncbi:MAG: redoxin family protein [Limisphaerales bacterium]